MTAAPAMREFPVELPDDVYSPATDRAIGECGELIRETWINLAGDHSVSGEYLRHLQAPGAIRYPYDDDRDRVGVINELPQADWLEEGRSGFHLPQRWGTRKGRWKTSKDGTKYATVPFRHRTPSKDGGGSTPERRRMEMPLPIYNAARKLDHRQRLKASDTIRFFEGRKLLGTGQVGDVGQRSKPYDHYRQIFGEGQGLEGLGQGYTWKTPSYVGMVHQKDAEGKHGGYFTYRTITQDSPGWYIPPTPAHHYARRALDQAAPMIEVRLKAAAAMDMALAVAEAASPLFEM